MRNPFDGRLKQIKTDARFKSSLVYTLITWIKNPTYAALRRQEARFYSNLLGPRRDGLIFDLGASLGLKAEIFRRYGRVVCVEPDPVALEMLRMRFAQCRDVEIVAAAISNHSGSAVMFEFEPGSSFNTLSSKWAAALADESNNRFGFSMLPTEKQVRVVTIDELGGQYGVPRYIKIDIEGSEALAIEAMHQPCELVSAEFNLPEFARELGEVICHLQELGTDVRFNVAITEPPLKFEFDEWLPGSKALEQITEAGWGYVELFCKMAVAF